MACYRDSFTFTKHIHHCSIACGHDSSYWKCFFKIHIHYSVKWKKLFLQGIQIINNHSIMEKTEPAIPLADKRTTLLSKNILGCIWISYRNSFTYSLIILDFDYSSKPSCWKTCPMEFLGLCVNMSWTLCMSSGLTTNVILITITQSIWTCYSVCLLQTYLVLSCTQISVKFKINYENTSNLVKSSH
jgi:hypothetical protein